MGVPRQGQPMGGGELEDGLGQRRLGVFDVLGLIQHDAVPLDAVEQLGILAGQGKGGDHNIVVPAELPEGFGLFGAIAAVVHRCPDIGRKLVDFVEPVADHGSGSNQQGRRNPLLLRLGQFPLLHQTGDYLHGFAQAHVIR